ncbi:MAG: calcium-binding protein, partial [Solirubrobacterales bacterium]
MTARRLIGAFACALALALALAAGPAGASAATCDGHPATIARGGGDNTIQGTPGSDVIVAGAGDDVVHGD